MYYKDIPEYYNKTQLNNIYNPKDKNMPDGDIYVGSQELYTKFEGSISKSLDGVLPSKDDDYDKTVQDMYDSKELSKQNVKLTYLPDEEKKAKTAISKDMRKTYKLAKARELVSSSHMYSAASETGGDFDPKLLQSFENTGLANHIEPSDTQHMKDSIEFLKDPDRSQEEKQEFLKNHIDKIADYKDSLLEKGTDKDFAFYFDPNYHKASMMEGLGYIPDLAQKFNIQLDDATKRKCEYLGKLGKSAKENLNANAQRISDVAYGTLEENSAKQFADAFNAAKDASDEIDPNKNTYYNRALEDCKKANYDLMKAFMKESVAELNIDPETAFIDANGNIAKIDDLDKINPNLNPTVIFDADGNLKSFVDFDDLSGKPTTYENVETYDLGDKDKVQEACENFKYDLEKNDLFKNAEDEDLKAIKDNLDQLSNKDNEKVNSQELTEKTITSCRNYINKVKNDPNASQDAIGLAHSMGDMYRSMCCSLGKYELEKSKEKENEKTNEKNNEKENEKTLDEQNEINKQFEKDLTKSLNTKTKNRSKEIDSQKKQREKDDKEYEKILDEINDLDGMTSIDNDDSDTIDFEATEKLQEDLAKDTKNINGTNPDIDDENLSLSVEKQKAIKDQERQSVNPEKDEGSINRSDSKGISV